MSIVITYFKTPFGELVLGSHADALCLADWRYRKMRTRIDKRIQLAIGANFEEGDSVILRQTKEQLDEYFSAKRSAFDIPLHFCGTPFQKRVWQALLTLPFGTTSTYYKLSKQLGNTNAIRAVASANGANAISILVPCHRIIGINGDLVGYAGGLQAKKKLLQLEGALLSQPTLNLFSG